MPAEPKYWFPAKRYGWGWGPPTCWQGWAVMAIFVGLVAACALRFLPSGRPGAFLACTALLALLLTGICWLKGERPSWRWGK